MTKKAMQASMKTDRQERAAEQAHAEGWRPVRRGRRFCSPHCGGGCMHAAYLKAHTQADRLVKRLGQGWQSQVWENLGWHWAVVRGAVRVKVNQDGTYRAELGDAGHQFIGEGETLVEAISAMRTRSLAALQALNKLINDGSTAWYQAVDSDMRSR